MQRFARTVRPPLLAWLVASIGLVGPALFAQPPDTSSASAWEETDRRPGEGERCLVCGQRVEGSDIVEIRYKGRTFHVKAMMLEEFAADPDGYFADLQARGALFDERAMEGRRTSRGWLHLGVYIFIGLISAAVAGTVAVGRGLAPLPWFFAGLAGNVAALLLLVIVGKRTEDAPDGAAFTKLPTTRAPADCPHCGASNHPSARSCAGCNTVLDPVLEAEAARA